jgi:hypothetical protein
MWISSPIVSKFTANNKRGARRGTGKRGSKQRNALTVRPVSLPPRIYGFPEKMYTKMRYCDFYALTSTSGSIGKQVFKLNSTYDPDSTGGGHQPLYRDVYAGIYAEYSVVKATIKVTFTSNATTSSVIVGAVIEDDSSSASNINVLMEQSAGTHLMLPNNTSSIANRTISQTWDAAKYLGIDPFSSQGYKTPAASDPTDIVYALIYATPVDGVSSTVTSALVEIEQWVLWTELTTPTVS